MVDGFALREEYMDHARTPPKEVVEWFDPESDAVGYLAVNSWRGGAAGGGTRMRRFATADEARKTAIDLAKTMEMKFRVSGPDIGGAKSVISYSPGADKDEVLRRWFRYIWPYLKDRYGTGGDLNVDDKDVIRLFGEVSSELSHGACTLADPQQGIVYGFYSDHHAERINSLQNGVPQRVDGLGLRLDGQAPTTLDLITGFGVAYAAKRFHEMRDESIRNKRIVMEGFGNVGAAAAYFFAEAGAQIVGIITLDPQNPSRLLVRTAERNSLDITKLISERVGNELGAGDSIDADDQSFWDTRADVFIPAATSGTIDEDRVKRLVSSGVKLISPGANVPFRAPAIEKIADAQLAVLPDFIANCGMARAYAHFMEHWRDGDASNRWPALANDVEATIADALEQIRAPSGDITGHLDRAYRHYISEILHSGA